MLRLMARCRQWGQVSSVASREGRSRQRNTRPSRSGSPYRQLGDSLTSMVSMGSVVEPALLAKLSSFDKQPEFWIFLWPSMLMIPYI